MKLSVRIFLIILLVSFAIISCQNQKAAVSSGSGKGGTTIATVNGAPVTDEDVRFEISMLPENLQQMATDGEGIATLMDDVLKKEMLYQEAKKKNLDKSEEYKHRLHDLERRLIVEMLLTDEVEKRASVSDEDVKKFYDDNREKFISPSEPDSKPVPFEQVKGLIKDRLLQQKQREAFQEYVEALTKTYTIKLNEDAIQKAFGIEVGEKIELLENTIGADGQENMGTEAPVQTNPESEGAEKTQE